MVIVRLNYCNSLYHGLPMKSTKRLQLAHSSAARLITLTPRFEPISPILKQLHWLPIHKRCQYTILVVVYKDVHASARPIDHIRANLINKYEYLINVREHKKYMKLHKLTIFVIYIRGVIELLVISEYAIVMH